MLQSNAEHDLREAADEGNSDWMVAGRAGLRILLQAKLGPALRQAVLCLTARLASLSPPTWLYVSCPFTKRDLITGRLS